MPPQTTTSLATLSVRVTGFEFMYASFHAYTTVVTLEGATWSLGIRYSKFLNFYEALKAAESSFKFDFPPRGGFFSKPKPEDRQVRLDAFLRAVIKFYQVKKQPPSIRKLLCEFLQVERNYNRANKFQTKRESARLVEKPEAKVVSVSKDTLAEKAQGGKTTQVNVATVVAAVKDNFTKDAVSNKKDKESKNEEVKDNGNKIDEVVVEENKIEEEKVDENKIQEETVDKNKIEEEKVDKKTTEEEKVDEKKIEEEKVDENNRINKEKVDESKVEAEKVDKNKIEEQNAKENKTVEMVNVVEETKNETKGGCNQREEEKWDVFEETKKEVEETLSTNFQVEKVDEVKLVLKETSADEIEVEKAPSEVGEVKETKDKSDIVDVVKEILEVAETKSKDTSSGTTKITTTTTTPMGSTVVETNVTSQPSPNKTVVGKTVTITSKLDDVHSFKVEMTENRASVVTLGSTTEQKSKKKKRNGRRKSMSSAPNSTTSTASDGFESPDGVDQLGSVSDLTLTEAQKKARNQRRKEKRKKKQKKLLATELEQ